MPHAVAKINDKVLAETDSYEFVEGNVYVCHDSLLQLHY